MFSDGRLELEPPPELFEYPREDDVGGSNVRLGAL
jgi:hypothetical protein